MKKYEKSQFYKRDNSQKSRGASPHYNEFEHRHKPNYNGAKNTGMNQVGGLKVPGEEGGNHEHPLQQLNHPLGLKNYNSNYNQSEQPNATRGIGYKK